MPKWYHIPVTARMTEGEYHANITGMNVVFGAVLGFVLAGTEALSIEQFVFVLLVAASGVVTIFYLGSSPYKLFYAALGVGIVAALPWLLRQVDIPNLPKLQATLAVWLAVVAFIEALPRAKEDSSSKDEAG